MFGARSTWNPIWQFSLTKAKIGVAVGLTWDPLWQPSLTKTKTSMFIARSTWNPIWRFPLTKAEIGVCSSGWKGFNLSFSFENFLIGSFHFIIVLESKPWFFVINSMILSMSTILLDYIKDSSCNNAKKHSCNDLWLDVMHVFLPGFET